MERVRSRIPGRKAKVAALKREEAFDIARGALRIANEVCGHPYGNEEANVVSLNAAENASGEWNVALNLSWDYGHAETVWVDIPAGALTEITIQVQGCELCRQERLRGV